MHDAEYDDDDDGCHDDVDDDVDVDVDDYDDDDDDDRADKKPVIAVSSYKGLNFSSIPFAVTFTYAF